MRAISSLLVSHRTEGDVLEPPHLGLQQAQVHARGPAVVVTLDVFHVRAFDLEERHTSPVHTSHLDARELAAAREREAAEEEVIRVQHAHPPPGGDPRLSQAEASTGIDHDVS
jgi:proteasome lid subunit RPN8/RPN11